MQLFAYFSYKFLTLVVDLDFKAPMPTYLVQKLSNIRSWFVLGWFRFRTFWKIVNQDDDMLIPINVWKVTDVHSNLLHHTGIDFNSTFGDFRSPCFWHCLQLLTYSLISAAILCQIILCTILSYVVFFLYVRPLPWSVQNLQYLGARLW